VRIELERLPLADGVADVCAALGVDAHELAASAGEDYELCFCVLPELRTRAAAAVAETGGGADVAWIGEIDAGPAGLSLVAGDGRDVRLGGFEHAWQ
jgi:thiamine-monophosphate kinase